MEIRSVGIVGAGQMGNWIAHVFALAGYDVLLNDISAAGLEKAIATIDRNLERQVTRGKTTAQAKAEAMARIKTTLELPALGPCDLIIEAATEKEEIKDKIFAALLPYLAPHTILTSNTSSISITRLASVTDRPERFIGIHFMNPVPVMKLVEIINGVETSAATTQSIVELTNAIDKIPCVVKDAPGFIANRILMPMINEAIYSLYEGIAGVEEIDTIMKLGMAHPMGPLQLADFIGLDVCLSILNVLQDGFGNPKYSPCSLLKNMVTAGKKGVKSGEGFYSWTHGTKDLIVAPNFKK